MSEGPITKIFCTSCGTQAVTGSSFCAACGASLALPSAENLTLGRNPAQQMEPQVPVKKRRRRWAVLIIAVLLLIGGGAGFVVIHRQNQASVISTTSPSYRYGYRIGYTLVQDDGPWASNYNATCYQDWADALNGYNQSEWISGCLAALAKYGD